MAGRVAQWAATDREKREQEERRWCGRWYQMELHLSNCASYQQHACESKVRYLRLPPYEFQKKKPVVAKQPKSVVIGTSHNVAEPVLFSGRNRRKCFIATLPDELLLQILLHLAPTGMTFQVFRYVQVKQALGTIFHAFGSSKSSAEWPPTISHAAAMATVSRRFSDLFRELLYVISLGSTLKAETQSKDIKDLRNNVEKTLAALGPNHKLKRLKVHVGGPDGLFMSGKVSQACRPPQASLRCVRRSDENVAIEVLESRGGVQEYEAVVSVWEVVGNIRGVKDVSPSGMITDEAAVGLCESMRSSVGSATEDIRRQKRQRII
ncbi:hypothetical protein LTR17_009043 [Elasticomyces elasticus]|nr:hypothetical protein LTR17_009043 [Elasticomyces elasticus]